MHQLHQQMAHQSQMFNNIIFNDAWYTKILMCINVLCIVLCHAGAIIQLMHHFNAQSFLHGLLFGLFHAGITNVANLLAIMTKLSMMFMSMTDGLLMLRLCNMYLSNVATGISL